MTTPVNNLQPGEVFEVPLDYVVNPVPDLALNYYVPDGELPSPVPHNMPPEWSDYIADLQTFTHHMNKHWWRDPATGEPQSVDGMMVPTKLMLIVSELAEAMEGHRKGLMDDKLPHRPMFEVELADALIRLLDLAGATGIDLGGAYVEKMLYNRSREDHTDKARLGTHGKRY